MRYLGLALLGTVLVGPVPGAAQMRAEFGPVFGYYRPYGAWRLTSFPITRSRTHDEDRECTIRHQELG
jgi:hypothetical protein